MVPDPGPPVRRREVDGSEVVGAAVVGGSVMVDVVVDGSVDVVVDLAADAVSDRPGLPTRMAMITPISTQAANPRISSQRPLDRPGRGADGSAGTRYGATASGGSGGGPGEATVGSAAGGPTDGPADGWPELVGSAVRRETTGTEGIAPTPGPGSSVAGGRAPQTQQKASSAELTLEHDPQAQPSRTPHPSRPFTCVQVLTPRY